MPNTEFDLLSVEGVPNIRLVPPPPPAPPRRYRRLLVVRNLTLVALGVLMALVIVRATLRFHVEYNVLADVRQEGIIYWRTVCNEGLTRPPNSYDQCTRAKTDAHQFTRHTLHAAVHLCNCVRVCSLLALERVLHQALQDVNPLAGCVSGTSCAFVWMKASEAAIRLMDSFASNLTLALGLLSYGVYANIGPVIWTWVCSRVKGRRRESTAKSI